MTRPSIPLLFFVLILSVFCQGQVNFSLEKETVSNAGNSISTRMEAFRKLTTGELEQSNAEAVIEMSDLLLELPLSKKQKSDVIARKSVALRKSGQGLEAYALLTETIAQTNEDEDDILAGLHYERGRTAPYVFSADQELLAKTLDDFNVALTYAVDADNTEMQCQVHDQLGFLHGNYLKDRATARAHYEFIIFNADDEVSLAQARTNLAKLSKPEDRIERDTAIHYLMSSRAVFSRNGLDRKVGKATITIANYLREAEQFDEAKLEYESALKMGLKVGDQIICMEYLGLIANEQARYDDAERWLNQALVLDKGVNYGRGVYLSSKFGQTLVNTGRAQQAYDLCDSILQKLETDTTWSDFKKATRLTDCWDCIGKAQIALNRFQEAFDAFENRDRAEKTYRAIQDANQSKKKLDLYEYDTLRKQAMQENQYRLQSERQTYLYAIVALLIAFAMFITYRYRFTQRQSH